MFFESLFNKYYQQISVTLLPVCKKSLMRVYARDIQSSLTALEEYECQEATALLIGLIDTFQKKSKMVFKPLALPEDLARQEIKDGIAAEWAGFFKTLSVLLDKPNFYKAIEDRFQRYYNGIVHEADLLAKDAKLIVEIQSAYDNAVRLGKSKESLVQNLRYLPSEKTSSLFQEFHITIEQLRDDYDNYSPQVLQSIQAAAKSLSAQVETILSEERELQSGHERFFLNYRLQISKRVDPICESLKIFHYRSVTFRSEFVEALIGFEHEHSEDLESIRRILDRQLESLIQEVTSMRAIEQASEKSRSNIKSLSKTNNFQFFQEFAEESEQLALRSIGDSIRDVEAFPVLIQRIEGFEQTFRDRIRMLAQTERQYIKLSQNALKLATGEVKFSFSALNLDPANIEALFPENSSYNLVTGQFSSYDAEANLKAIDKAIVDGTLLNIGNLGNLKSEAITIPEEIGLDNLLSALDQKRALLQLDEAIGFVPILVDEQERIDVPQILFFSKRSREARPELLGLLEMRQQGKLLYIRKIVCVLPMPSHILNDLLEGYKTSFRDNSKKVAQLIEDQYLANKLKLDFQGKIAQAMTQAKRRLRAAYIEDLKQEILQMIATDGISTDRFLKTVDSLIIETLDSLIHGDEEKPQIW
jgi:hypothetical protein